MCVCVCVPACVPRQKILACMSKKLWVKLATYMYYVSLGRSLVDNVYVPYCLRQAHVGACSSSTKNWGWAVAQKCLNGSTFPVQAPIPDAELASKGYRIFALPMFHWGQPDAEEALYRGPKADRPIASFPSFCNVFRLQNVNFVICCKQRTLQTRLLTGVCEMLLPDVVVPEVHQNDCSSYIHE